MSEKNYHKVNLRKVGKNDTVYLKNKNGITLIALIITIIVILILVAVSVRTITGSGLFDHAKDATRQWADAQQNESEISIDNIIDEYGIYDNVDRATPKLEDFTNNPDNYKHKDQHKDNGDRGLGTDGNAVNMDLWQYYIIDENEKTIGLGDKAVYGETSGYADEDIVNGRIQGKVPQYIKIDGKDGIYTVTSMSYTFRSCTNLVVAPVLPSTVTDLYGTFANCSNLRLIQKFPEKVEDMSGTFWKCTKIESVPTIPINVKTLVLTFMYCENLKSPIIVQSKNVNEVDRICGYRDNTTQINVIRVPINSTTYIKFSEEFNDYEDITIETF